jgi:anti-anti-sigma factor
VRVTSEIKDGVAIVTLSGRLVFDTSMILHAEVRKWLDAGTKSFIFNVSDISYCDSAGCGELIDIFSTVGKAAGAVAFLKPSERVHGLWARIRLTDIFNIFDTMAEAEAFFRR